MSQHYVYLIVGGGMTAESAARGIRQFDQTGSIGMFSAELDPPYNRPPLTKGLWKNKPLDSIWRKTAGKKIQLHLGQAVAALNPIRKQVTTALGDTYTYEKLLLATGGSPHRLPFGGEAIIYFRTLADYRRLRVAADLRQRFAVIGDGFIGTELAAALAMNGKEVHFIFRSATIGAGHYPAELSAFLSQYYAEKGVHLLPNDEPAAAEKRGDEIWLRTGNGHELVVDAAVAGLGIAPNVGLARDAELLVDDGIVVDEFCRTSAPDVFAAGDVAEFYNLALDRRLRIEHEDNANMMGLFAGRNMTGNLEPYNYLPYFYSDLFDLGYEAVGELDARYETFADWTDRNHKGTIYYLRDKQVRGVLLWNVWEKTDIARALIGQQPFPAGAGLAGRIAA